MKTLTVTAPALWASAIINNDYSGLSKEDTSQLNTFLAMQGLSFSDCLDCRDAGFMWKHDAFEQCPYGAECQEYIFKV